MHSGCLHGHYNEKEIFTTAQNAHWWRLGRATFFLVQETYKSLTSQATISIDSSSWHHKRKKKTQADCCCLNKVSVSCWGLAKHRHIFRDWTHYKPEAKFLGRACRQRNKWAAWVCQTCFSASQYSGLEFSVPFRASESFLWLMELSGTANSQWGSTVLLDYYKANKSTTQQPQWGCLLCFA